MSGPPATHPETGDGGRYPGPMRPPARLFALVAVTAAALAAGCGRSQQRAIDNPRIGASGSDRRAAPALGFPGFATKNTTRVGGADPVADAAAIARAVYPSSSASSRPRAVTLVDAGDWRVALAASVLMSSPIRAPILFSDGGDLPDATAAALEALAPAGSEPAGRAQVIRIGDVPHPKGMRTTDLVGRDPFALARAIDAFAAQARDASSDTVIVASADRPEYAMPAACLAAKAGIPILFARRDSLPEATRTALVAHQQPRIYVLGPSRVISPKVTSALRRLGTVKRARRARTPSATRSPSPATPTAAFGWGVVDPGHGLVFANPSRPADAAAAAPLSASGTYGPLLLVDRRGRLPASLSAFLLDIQPGYAKDPARGVYNHGWIVGDDSAVSPATQARIDGLLEITPASNKLPNPTP